MPHRGGEADPLSPATLAILLALAEGQAAQLRDSQSSGCVTGGAADGTRTGSGGGTWSARWAATSTIRRALQQGQAPGPLQENATRRSAAHASQRMRANLWASMPQRR
jgi:hypothetical protein